MVRLLQLLRVCEPVLILVITSLLSVTVPAAFSCTPMACFMEDSNTVITTQPILKNTHC
jgi:hypothetical protein